MEKKENIANIFPKHLFWDMDPSKLAPERDQDIIIPRALFATTKKTFQEDIKRLERLYSRDEILYHLKNTKERLDNEICKMISERYYECD